MKKAIAYLPIITVSYQKCISEIKQVLIRCIRIRTFMIGVEVRGLM